jgi:glycine dehydrogenase
MIAIRREIEAVAQGVYAVEASPLRLAPHTVEDMAAEEWDRPYSRREGCFPTAAAARFKYWSPVNRIDNIYGDRNLMCSCPPVEAFA